MSDPHADRDREIERFWSEARRRGKLESLLPGYFGAAPITVVVPPAWSFGADADQADRLLALVLEGTKTATASAFEDYTDDDPVPERGSLGILLDGAGHPRALIATTEVSVVPFDEVDEEHAYAEGEGDRTLRQWRVDHEEFFTAVDPLGRGFRRDMPVVLEHFTVLYRH
ncbi:ASCH domain-containing protein [Nocardioides sp. GBK3QG-3]|uniref:ASCH domain-containing protein n=1 Tax=Nocardioides mangrovi TaxID=2874580 RepID=A0ABS7UG16_9ACTN|nr:ASCH domain-containing protein [Nocardioides mangrovi]MBZ5739968.1 ASCH domain-containing protein [Nocardioides mangrovi]